MNDWYFVYVLRILINYFLLNDIQKLSYFPCISGQRRTEEEQTYV